jgi:hypothetical protein
VTGARFDWESNQTKTPADVTASDTVIYFSVGEELVDVDGVDALPVLWFRVRNQRLIGFSCNAVFSHSPGRLGPEISSFSPLFAQLHDSMQCTKLTSFTRLVLPSAHATESFVVDTARENWASFSYEIHLTE